MMGKIQMNKNKFKYKHYDADIFNIEIYIRYYYELNSM